MDDQQSAGLFSIGAASEYLGISIDTLRRWERKGRIEPLRSPGGHRYFKKEDLDNLFGRRYTREEPANQSTMPDSTPIEQTNIKEDVTQPLSNLNDNNSSVTENLTSTQSADATVQDTISKEDYPQQTANPQLKTEVPENNPLQEPISPTPVAIPVPNQNEMLKTIPYSDPGVPAATENIQSSSTAPEVQVASPQPIIELPKISPDEYPDTKVSKPDQITNEPVAKPTEPIQSYENDNTTQNAHLVEAPSQVENANTQETLIPVTPVPESSSQVPLNEAPKQPVYETTKDIDKKIEEVLQSSKPKKKITTETKLLIAIAIAIVVNIILFTLWFKSYASVSPVN
ncbi:MAG TPA: MerR family DNA-binding transcriptional regulator [Patescibacteria group bacterium]|nr:MerR family DNA-binding transcriptional regulator [Patescibacteria group bacterium]